MLRHPLLYAATAVALHSARASSGRFDPTLLCEIEALGYDRDFALIAERETVGSQAREPTARPPFVPGKWRGIELDPAGRRIRLPKDGRLDLGGIAKGWAADVAFHRFGLEFGGVLINLGGDLRAHGGPQEGENWSVGIRDPRFERVKPKALPPTGTPTLEPMQTQTEPPTGYAAILGVSRGGLATSGALRRWWLQNGKRQHHLLNPETGLPMELWIDAEATPRAAAGTRPLIATATALAPTAARAEVAAKVALLRGYPLALREVEAAWERPIPLGRGMPINADAAVALVLTVGTGEIAVSSNLESYLATWGSLGHGLKTTARLT